MLCVTGITLVFLYYPELCIDRVYNTMNITTVHWWNVYMAIYGSGVFYKTLLSYDSIIKGFILIPTLPQT